MIPAPEPGSPVSAEQRRALEDGLDTWAAPHRRRRAGRILRHFGIPARVLLPESTLGRVPTERFIAALQSGFTAAITRARKARASEARLIQLAREGWRCWLDEVVAWSAREPQAAALALTSALDCLSGDLEEHPEATELLWHRELCILTSVAHARVAASLSGRRENVQELAAGLESIAVEELAPETAVFLLSVQGRLAARSGELGRALEYLDRAEAVLIEAAATPEARLAVAVERAATVTYLPAGDPARLAALEDLASNLGSLPPYQAPGLDHAAQIALALSLALSGRCREALACLKRAKLIWKETRKWDWILGDLGSVDLLRSHALEIRGLAQRGLGRLKAAEKSFYAAYQAYRRLDSGLDCGRVLLLLIELARAQGRKSEVGWLDVLLTEHLSQTPELRQHLLARVESLSRESEEPHIAREAERLAAVLAAFEDGVETH